MCVLANVTVPLKTSEKREQKRLSSTWYDNHSSQYTVYTSQ